MIAGELARARAEGLSLEDAARRTATEARAARKRLPGLGHRVHQTDPRTAILFDLARAGGIAGGLAGTRSARHLAERRGALNIVFAIVIIAVALYMLARNISLSPA